VAGHLALEDGVPIYTIGAGPNGNIPDAVFDAAGHRIGTEMQAVEVDTLMLQDVSAKTGGCSSGNECERRPGRFASDRRRGEDRVRGSHP